MTFGTRTDCSVIIGLPDRVALLTAAHHRRSTFCRDEWMRRALRSSGLVLLRESDLLWLQTLLAIDCRPRCCCMTAAQEFLIDIFVAGAAISCGEMGGDYESVMILLLLAFRRLVAVKAIDALFCWADISYSWTIAYCMRA